MLERSRGNDGSRSGIYVWQQSRTLTLAANAPKGYATEGATQSKKTVLGGVADVADSVGAQEETENDESTVSSFKLNPITVPDNPYTLKRGSNAGDEDYKFDGWVARGAKKHYAVGQTLDLTAGDVILDAQWRDKNGHVVVVPSTPPTKPQTPSAPKEPATPSDNNNRKPSQEGTKTDPAGPSTPTAPSNSSDKLNSPQLAAGPVAEGSNTISPNAAANLNGSSVLPQVVSPLRRQSNNAPSGSGNGMLQCEIEPSAYRLAVSPAAYMSACGQSDEQSMAAMPVNSAHQSNPLWLLLLTLFTLFLLFVIYRHSDRLVVSRHRGSLDEQSISARRV